MSDTTGDLPIMFLEPADKPFIYVCHPFKDDPEGNKTKVLAIARQLLDAGYNPIAPILYYPQFIDDKTERRLGMECCLAMLHLCDEIWVYGSVITEGMQEEIKFAGENYIPIQYVR